MTVERISISLAALGSVFFLASGIWPFIDARGFFDAVATFEPFNAHFIHDIGAFQIGLGVTLGAALWRRKDALFAALLGAGAASAFHAIAHVRDNDLGGADSDPVVFGVMAVLLMGVAVWRVLLARSR